jgi:hypothetical protein
MIPAEKSDSIITFHEVEWDRKPLLVTGAPRSGTTWVGKMLSLPGQFHYLHEPFNPDHPLKNEMFNIRMSRYMMYVTEELENYEKKYFKSFKQLIEGKCSFVEGLSSCRSLKDFVRVYHKTKEYRTYYKLHIPPLVKDPIAIMSAGWLARTFDINVIVMIRHPAAIVASMKRLNWSFEPLNWALSQPLLLRDYLSPYEEELKEISTRNADIIDRLAMLWKIVYHVVHRYKQEYPGWLYIKHEDLARDPLVQFEDLYRKLNLDFTDDARRKIDEYCSSRNPTHASGQNRELKLFSNATISNWKKMLSVSEIERIRHRVEDVSGDYYTDSDWELA